MNLNQTTMTYDRVASAYAARATHPLQAELDQFAALLPPKALVLDIGSGPGQYSRALRGRGCRVIELDLSLGMLQVARSQTEPGFSPSQVLADMRYLPVPGAACDGCFACASLLHLPRTDVSPTLLGFHRVLRPGGTLYVCVKEGRGQSLERETWGSPRLFTYYRPDEICTLLNAASFDIVASWINPPGPGQQHRWINLFALARR